jgi:glycosyltransferase involved in cell wall biosynthesis
MTPNQGAPIRVAFVGHKMLPANYSGIEVYAEEVGARLAARGHEVLSFTNGLAEEHLVHRGVQCHRVGQVDGKHMGALTQAFTATIAACRADVDIVHFMAMGPSIFAPIVRLFSSAQIVVTVAGRDDQRRKWGTLARRLMWLSYLTCTRMSDCVIGVSQALADELAPVTKRRCVHISNGVSVPPRPSVDLASFGLDRPYLLYAGRLVPEKRVEDLLAAFARIDGDIDLVIAGGPAKAKGYLERLESIAAGDPRVRMLGHRSAEEVDALMRGASAFVLPSELEGQPIALLEATGRGVPVVVSNLPCNREVLGDSAPGAHLVPVGDIDALAAALQACIDDPAAIDDASARAVRIRDTYRWDTTSEQVEDVYVDVLRTRRRTSARRARRARAERGATLVEPTIEPLTRPAVRPPGVEPVAGGATAGDAVDAVDDRRAPGPMAGID